MKWTTLALLGALSSCSAAAQPSKTTATVVASLHVPLSSYQTFSFGLSDPPKTGYEVSARSLEVQRRLRPVVLAQLQQRGYVASEAPADLVVKLAAGTGPDEVRGDQSKSERTISTGLARGYIGINVYDRATGSELWQGSAFAEIDPAKIDDSLLAMGVAHMLQDFPARDNGGVATAH